MMRVEEPTKVLIPTDDEKVRRFLTYNDRSVQYQMHKLRQNFRWKSGDPEGFDARMEALKAQSKKTLMFHDPDGRPYTYSGLVPELQQQFGWQTDTGIIYPESKPLPWNKPPVFDQRPYQVSAFSALLNARHAATELPTAAGKTSIIVQLVKHHGLKTLVVTPSKSITLQIYDEMVERFGLKYVGMYGGTKKQFNKLITVCTAQSLTRLQPGSPEHEALSKTDVLVFDECHTTPAQTFESVCMGIASKAPYRYFVSATQTRIDGSEILLKGITGPIVYRKTFRELVEEGWLARPIFRVFKVNSYGNANRQDVNKETRAQLFCNPNVAAMASDLAVKAATIGNRQVLILVDEYSQYDLLKNYLKHDHIFVCGKTHQDDRKEAIRKFNAGEIKMLVGTSAISTGVDLKPVGCLIYLQGGTSEIQVKQALGRGTRIVPGKKDVWMIDFLVVGSKAMERHARARMGIYETMGDVLVVG